MTYAEETEAVVRATTIHSPIAYSWLGKPSPKLHASVRRALTSQVARKYLLGNLQFRLYKSFYCSGLPTPADEDVAHSEIATTLFVQQLSAANCGLGCYSSGWTVHRVGVRNLVIRSAGLDLWVEPSECLVPADTHILPGTIVGLRFPKELLSIAPGFYVALGNNELNPEQPLVRLYWNLTAEGSVGFMSKATGVLNGENVPFKIKVLNDPARFTRRDSAVLYLHKSDYQHGLGLLERLYCRMLPALKSGQPAFTKQLAPGLGLAEDPGRGDSFGSHRCGILAEGLIRAYEKGLSTFNERLRVVRSCLEEAGISLQKPFLSKGSVDEYDFGPPLPRRSHKRCLEESSPRPATILRMAEEIGLHFIKDAVWHNGCCNWVGTDDGGGAVRSELAGKQFCALGPDLYSGTSGIALFLAELYSATGHAGARCCALGALRQALARFDAMEQRVPRALYTGWSGVALAATSVGLLLGESEIVDRASRMLRTIMSVEEYLHAEFDLISGKAGAIIALVVLNELSHDHSLVEIAVRIGDELLRSAERREFGYSWRSPKIYAQRNLTGFAHGTAGVGFALLELFRLTGKSRYREGAEQAFRYERHWFDREACNWPDFRRQLGESKNKQSVPRFATAWCHGAPGIALSRLRAYELIEDPVCKDEALAALRTTSQITNVWMRFGSGSYSLCHGLLGNADILLYGWQVLGQEFRDGLALARTAAAARIANLPTSQRVKPCADIEPLGLMLGLAGVGYFLLRLCNPSIRSPLSFVSGPPRVNSSERAEAAFKSMC
jgi:hypothetical protein